MYSQSAHICSQVTVNDNERNPLMPGNPEPYYLSGASPIEKSVLQAALKRLNMTAVHPNLSYAVAVQLADQQPAGYRYKEWDGPMEYQRTQDKRALYQAMVPDGYAAEDLRVVAHKIFALKTCGGAPLAFYKQYAFQLRRRLRFPTDG